MWPWGHAAAAYLLYSAWCHARDGRPPEAIPLLALGLGSQIPDLIDKPLAWWFAVLPTGRSLGHSLLVAVPILLVLWWVIESRESVLALGFGWISHALGDAVPSIAAGDWSYASFLLWPLLSIPPPGIEQSVSAHVREIEPTARFLAELLLVAAALYAWRRDGYPGRASRETAPDRPR